MPAEVATLAVGLVLNTGKFFGQLDTAMGRGAKLLTSAGMKMSAAITAPLVGIGVAVVKAAVSYESAFAGVIKTVEEATDAHGNLTTAGLELRQMFRDLAKEIPIPIEQLARIGELAGQLGVPLDQIENFTANIAKLAATTDLSIEAAATQLARFQNITGASDEPIDRLASTIVHLGNNLATTESELVNFAMRIAGAGKQVGLTQAQILALGGALSSAGIRAEAGGTAVSRILIDMASAVAGSTGEMIDSSAAIEDLTVNMGFLEREVAIAEENFHRQNAELINARKYWAEGSNELSKFQGRVDKAALALDKKEQKLREQKDALAALHAAHGTVAEDTGKLEKMAAVAGISADEFKQAFEEDAANALLMFVQGLGRASDAGENVFGILEELDFQQIRVRDALLRMAGAGDLLGESLDLANEGWEENTALTREAELRFKTTAAQMQLMKSGIKDIAITLGDTFLPRLNELVGRIGPIIERFHEWARANPELIEKIALLGAGLAALGPILLLLGTLLGALAFLVSPAGLLIAGVVAFAAAWATNFGGLRDTILEFLEPIKAWVEENGPTIFEGLMAAFATIRTWLEENGPAIWSAVLGIAQTIIGAFDTVRAWFNENWPMIAGVVLTVWKIIQASMETVVGIIVGVVWPKLMAAFDTLTETLASFGISWSDVWNAVKQAISIVAIGIGIILLGLVAAFVGVVNAIATGLQQLVEGWQTLMTGVQQILNGIGQLIVSFINFWKAVFAGDLPSILEAWKTGWQGIYNVVQGILTALLGFIEMTLGTILAALWGFVEAFLGFFLTLKEKLIGGSIVPDIVNGIVAWFAKLPELIMAVLSGLAEGIGAILKGIFGPILEFDPTQVTEIFVALLAGIQKLIAQWQMFIDLLNLTWLEFSMYLLEESWPMLQEAWIALTTLMQDLWKQAMYAMQVEFAKLLAAVLIGIQKMIAKWNELKAVIDAVTAAINKTARAFKDMTSDKILSRFDRLINKVGDLISKMKKLEEAARAAAEAMKEASSDGGGGGGAVPGLQTGLWRVPGEMPAILHKGETVLPAGIAQAFRAAVLSFAGIRRGETHEGTTNYYFDMTVNTNAPSSTVIEDFDLMKALAGV